MHDHPYVEATLHRPRDRITTVVMTQQTLNRRDAAGVSIEAGEGGAKHGGKVADDHPGDQPPMAAV